MGVLETKGEIIYSTTDDGVFAKDSIDLAMDAYHNNLKKNEKTIVSMVYGEGGNLMDIHSYWNAFHYQEMRLAAIKPHFKMAQQFLMNKEYFISLGGYDCLSYEYQDAPVKDLIFYAQNDGAEVIFPPKHCLIATHLPGEEGDHSPIHHAQVDHDTPIFNAKYSDPNFLEEREINYDNWKSAPQIWERRFGSDPDKLPKTYEELCIINNYKFEKKVKEG